MTRRFHINKIRATDVYEFTTFHMLSHIKLAACYREFRVSGYEVPIAVHVIPYQIVGGVRNSDIKLECQPTGIYSYFDMIGNEYCICLYMTVCDIEGVVKFH